MRSGNWIIQSFRLNVNKWLLKGVKPHIGRTSETRPSSLNGDNTSSRVGKFQPHLGIHRLKWTNHSSNFVAANRQFRFVQRQPDQGNPARRNARGDLLEQASLILIAEVVKDIEHDNITRMVRKIHGVPCVEFFPGFAEHLLRDFDFPLIHIQTKDRRTMAVCSQIRREQSHAAAEIKQGTLRALQDRRDGRIRGVQGDLADRVAV